MAISGSEKAYTSARSGIARSGATRSNAVWPVYGGIAAAGTDITRYIEYGSLRITQAINEQPDTCSFNVRVVDSYIDALTRVGTDIRVGLGGAFTNLMFGGQILTAQTTRRHGQAGLLRSVMCADFLQVVESQYLITYDWPSQSATTTILDIVNRFFRKGAGGMNLSGAAVAAGLPSHAAFGVSNEKLSTVLRRITSVFPTGGGFYVDPEGILHVWQGASEPNQTPPTPFHNASDHLKAFAETVDGAQVRDAVIVEGLRTTAPIGMQPRNGAFQSFPVEDASILDKTTDEPGRELRVGTQRITARYAYGPWSAPVNTPLSTVVTADVAYDTGTFKFVSVPIASAAIFTGRLFSSWVKIDEMYLMVFQGSAPMLVGSSGWGCMTGPIKAGSTVTIVDSFSEITTTGRYDVAGSLEVARPQPIGADVVMTQRASQSPAIHEHIIQDGRYNRLGATRRGFAELDQFAAPLVSVQFETTDTNARPGRLQAYDFANPGGVDNMTGSLVILTADISFPVWGQLPLRVCTAAKVEAADVTDAWLVDRR